MTHPQEINPLLTIKSLEKALMVDFSRHKNSAINVALKTEPKKDISGFIDDCFDGKIINHSEDRAVQHMLFRRHYNDAFKQTESNQGTCAEIDDCLTRLKEVANQINKKDFKHIVHIGIGGSHLGPQLFKDFIDPIHTPKYDLHFLSNIDPLEWSLIKQKIDLKKTLFIIVSKSFGTLETLKNAEIVKNDLLAIGQNITDIGEQFIAISANVDRATKFGIKETGIIPLPATIGGRFSLWSSVSLSLILCYGIDVFEAFLKGGAIVDNHVLTATPTDNVPLIMARIGDYYINQEDMSAQAIIPYASGMRSLADYLQQLDMESNGKASDETKTGPVIFGQAGTNGQHAFIQWLHQGTHIVPSDIIAFAPKDDNDIKYDLTANAIAQSDALWHGKKDQKNTHKNFDGGRPVSLLMVSDYSAFSLGLIIALYEWKIMFQGYLWGINSFDQFGVELGKQLAVDTLHDLDTTRPESFDDWRAFLAKCVK